MASVGMMDSAYFVGRGELLAWANSTLGLNITKIEQARDGRAEGAESGPRLSERATGAPHCARARAGAASAAK